MIPQAIIPIDQIPVTVNGKVDTSRLPDLQETRDYAEGYAAPRNHVEEILCTVWSEVLELRRIGINDNFLGQVVIPSRPSRLQPGWKSTI